MNIIAACHTSLPSSYASERSIVTLPNVMKYFLLASGQERERETACLGVENELLGTGSDGQLENMISVLDAGVASEKNEIENKRNMFLFLPPFFFLTITFLFQNTEDMFNFVQMPRFNI